jgi:hypothetical protein
MIFLCCVQACVEGTAPPVPAHHYTVSHPTASNPLPTSSPPVLSYDDLTDQLTDVEQTIRFSDASATGLQRLDSVVNEFTSQFPVDSPGNTDLRDSAAIGGVQTL